MQHNRPRIRATAKQLGDRHFQINLSNRIALITQTLLRPGKNGRKARVKAGYFGFGTHDEAIAFCNEIRRRFPAARIAVRQSQRLTTIWEVKVAHRCVEELAWQLLYQGKSDSQRVAAHVDRWKQQTRQQSPKVAAQVRDRRIAVVGGRTTFNGVSID